MICVCVGRVVLLCLLLCVSFVCVFCVRVACGCAGVVWFVVGSCCCLFVLFCVLCCVNVCCCSCGCV